MSKVQLIRELKRLESELRFLAALGVSLVASDNVREMLESCARLVIPILADFVMIDMLNDDDELDRCVVLFADKNKQQAIASTLKQYPPQPGSNTAAAKVIESGELMQIDDVTDAVRRRIVDEAHVGAFLAAGIQSMMVLPLQAPGRILGVVTLGMAESGRRYTQDIVDLARSFANSVALSADHARLHAQEKRAVAARDSLLAAVSHDLRNLLDVIRLKAFSISKVSLGRIRNDMAIILRNSARMERLIRDLLDVSAIESGSFSLEMSRQAVGPILRSAVQAWQPVAEENSVRLECDFRSADPYEIVCDEGRIQQVLANLIGNAVKFTEPGGSISVQVEPRKNEICFSVRDSGRGISESDLSNVFDRFWRAADTGREGTGLGLAIAKGIVEAHGGRIWVESRVGSGSTFFFTLKLSPETRGPDSLLSEERRRQTKQRNFKLEQKRSSKPMGDDEVDFRETSVSRQAPAVCKFFVCGSDTYG